MRAVIFAIVAGASIAQAQPAPESPPSGEPANPPPSDLPIYPPEGATGTEPAPAPAPAPPAEPAPAPEPAPAAEAPAPVETPLPPAPEAAPLSSGTKDAAWLFVGGALTFVTAGAVLAYSTRSAEQDLKDLYATTSGRPPVFDEETQQRYDDLTAEGRRYEILAWTSFGLAAVCAGGAAYFFVKASNESSVTVTPTATPTSAGASLRFSF
jgi:hypothetical protein